MTNTELDREYAARDLVACWVTYHGPNARWHDETLYVAAAADGYVYLAPDEDSNVALAHVKVEHVEPLPDGPDYAWEDDYRTHSPSVTGVYEAP